MGETLMPVRVPQEKLITFVSRKNYNGRKLQRIWVNEDEIVKEMKEVYIDWKIEQVRYETLNMTQQIKQSQRTSILIGMHGAGMVNALWLQKGAKVIEIFPKY